MRYTLLQMVQKILSSLDSEEVNSISDTVEAQQVVNILETCYYDLAAEIDLPVLESLFQLNASGSSSKPVLMTMPSNVVRLNSLRYDNKTATETNPNYLEVSWQSFEDFLIASQALREETSGVGTMAVTYNGESFSIMYRTDRQPQFYTFVDQQTLLFDSFDSSLEATLQKTKTLGKGVVYPVFPSSDNEYPNLEVPAFSLLLNKAKVRAFRELKQQDNSEAIGEARRQKILSPRTKNRINSERDFDRAPKYGRK